MAGRAHDPVLTTRAQSGRPREAPRVHRQTGQTGTQQGKGPITDLSVLHGDFWPEEESIEDFLAALHEWRGHKRADPAA